MDSIDTKPLQVTDFHLDAITELINIGVGKAAHKLNEMTGAHIDLCVPEVKLVSPQALGNEILKANNTEFLSIVEINFSGSFTGSSSLTFSPESAAALVHVLVGDLPEETNDAEVREETLREVGNILISSIIGSFANVLGASMEFALPAFIEGNAKDIFIYDGEETDELVILALTAFNLKEHHISGEVVVYFEVESLHLLTQIIDGHSVS
ncbi:MAG: chemotaxis protein CheX [Mariprofundaceae bacterium]